MEIEKINLVQSYKNHFRSPFMDNITHIKTLPYITVAQAVEGSYTISLADGVPQNTGDGGFFIAPSGVNQTITHHADINSNNIACRWVFLKIKLNDIYNFDDLFELPTILPNDYKQQVNQLFDKIFSTDNKFQEFSCYFELIRLLSVISKPKSTNSRSRIKPAIDYIENNFKEHISVDMLASCVGISSPRFYTLFKEQMGISPIAYLNVYRLSTAVELLLTTEKTVTEIAAEVGIPDTVYFNKIFKKTYQTTPQKYRAIHK